MKANHVRGGKLARCLNLAMMLMNGIVIVGRYAKENRVHVRTVQRDMKALRHAGWPIEGFGKGMYFVKPWRKARNERRG